MQISNQPANASPNINPNDTPGAIPIFDAPSFLCVPSILSASIVALNRALRLTTGSPGSTFKPFTRDSLCDIFFPPSSSSLSLSLFLSLHFILQSDVRNHTFVWNEANSARDRVEESISHHHIFFFSKDKQIVKKIYFQRERA